MFDWLWILACRLCDLYNTVEESRPGVKFTDNVTTPARGNKKGDIYQLVCEIRNLQSSIFHAFCALKNVHNGLTFNI